MTANPNPTPQERLDAMVQKELREFTEYPLAEALESVALDLLVERDYLKDRLDAAEARVKALTAERDAWLIARFELWGCPDRLRCSEADWSAYQAAKARAALKLGGEK